MRGEGDSFESSRIEEKGFEDAPLLVAEPEFELCTLSSDDQFILLACDGLFDVFTDNADLVSFVKIFMETHKDVQKCCQALSVEAIKNRGSKDNVSIILIIINKWY